MISLKCKICGGTIISTAEGLVCDSCNTPVSEMSLDNEKKIESMNRANEARRKFDYDEAIRAYTQLLADDPDNAEINWNLALSKFGIEYESEMDAFGIIRFIPTIHRLRYENFDKDINYRKALRNADDNALDYYMAEGKRLSAIQSKLLELVRLEKDYDVFISFKAEDGAGNRTRDSLIAQEVYEQLTSRGIRTFYSRISLQNMTGDEYEPHIFAALNSAKVMILVATDLNYINYGWVKNEWSRYLDLKDEDASQAKTLIPVYENLPPNMFPKKIPMREAVDMTKKDAMLELIHGVTNLLGKKDFGKGNSQADMLVKKMQNALEQKDFSEVIRLGNEAITLAPGNGDAWFLLFMAENRAETAEQLTLHTINWMDSRYFSKAYEYSRGLRRQVLESVKQRYVQEQASLMKNAQAKEQARLAEEGSKKQVAKAKGLMQTGCYTEASRLLYDNVIPSMEVNELRNDCELGMEYEKINKKTYLCEKMKEKDAATVDVILGKRKKRVGIGGGFGNFKLYERLLCPIICLVSGVFVFFLGKNEIIWLSGIFAAVLVVSFLLFYYAWACVILDSLPYGFWSWAIHIGLALVLTYVTSALWHRGFLTKILVIAIYLAAYVVTISDFKNALSGEDIRKQKLYEVKIKPLEDELIQEYQNRYKKLEAYAPVEKLTTVWELSLMRRH